MAGAIGRPWGRQALGEMLTRCARLPRATVPLRAFDMVGLPALRAPCPQRAINPRCVRCPVESELPAGQLEQLVDELAANDRGLVMVMGKGGVGKTTLAAAIALGLVRRGKTVHLSTTDPAAHLAVTLGEAVPGLQVDRIDPKVETRRYVDKIMAARSAAWTSRKSPCCWRICARPAPRRWRSSMPSHKVAEARSAFVVLDTAPTGHSLLLMDATGAYHRQMLREFEAARAGS